MIQSVTDRQQTREQRDSKRTKGTTTLPARGRPGVAGKGGDGLSAAPIRPCRDLETQRRCLSHTIRQSNALPDSRLVDDLPSYPCMGFSDCCHYSPFLRKDSYCLGANYKELIICRASKATMSEAWSRRLAHSPIFSAFQVSLLSAPNRRRMATIPRYRILASNRFLATKRPQQTA